MKEPPSFMLTGLFCFGWLYSSVVFPFLICNDSSPAINLSPRELASKTAICITKSPLFNVVKEIKCGPFCVLT